MDIFIRIIADWLVIPIVLIGGGAMLWLPKKKYESLSWAVITGLVALLLAKVASMFYQGERPFMALEEVPKAAYLNNPGFPSDHTLLVFVITFIVWASTKNKPLSLALLVMSILVGLGRILALVHTPIDVAGGIACAFLAAAVVYGAKLFSSKA